MFDELLTPPPSVDLPALEVITPIDEVVAPVPAISTRSPSSTTVDQVAPSPSNSQTTPETQPPIIPNDVEEDNHDIEVAHMGNDPYFGIPIPEIPSDQSSSSDSIHTILHKQALFCYYNAFLTAVEPKTYKDAFLTVGCQDTRRSTSSSMQFLGDRLVSWSSKRSQLTDYGLGFNKISMYCDNKSAIALSCNNFQHSRSKHVDIRFHFIKEHVVNGVIELYFVNIEYQLADIFIKSLAREIIEFFINKLGMRSFTPETLKQLADEVDE
ncbi:hypothetical protein Tco_0144625 [Tanacetum coccineum]